LYFLLFPAFLLSKGAAGGISFCLAVQLALFLTLDKTLILKYYQFLCVFVELITVTGHGHSRAIYDFFSSA
jgi:hypothetical protein